MESSVRKQLSDRILKDLSSDQVKKTRKQLQGARPQVLFLDEATSSLDIENESKILNNIFNYCKNKILILVSHRRETLKRCDYILELDNGNLKKIKKND